MGLDAVKMELFKLKTQLIGVSKGIIGAVNTVDATIQMVDAGSKVVEEPLVEEDDQVKLIKLPDDTSMLNRLEWVGHFRAAVDELEADKKLVNRRSHLVNLRTIIDKAIADLDKLLEADPE